MTFSSSLDCLHEMLTYCRPHGSRAEEDFIQRYIRPLGMATDSAGNLHKRIGETDILWSCHTDTVHHKDGAQAIEVTSDGWVFAKDSDCLGGDCTAGVWLMVNMIQRRVPGWYVFHRAEEVGGLGSSYIAKKKRKQLGKAKAAIAFDRKGFTSVITHQFSRCCSDAFGTSLAAQLPGDWKLDDTGTFTDTANYTDDIGECTNISVGYLDQHTAKERQHGPFLQYLLDAVCEIRSSQLTFARQPGEEDERDWHDNSWWRDDDHLHYNSYDRDLFDTVLQHPDTVAEILANAGWTARDLELRAKYGG